MGNNIYQVRIYYEDTDCGGIVYHTNYIKYCERARSEIFFSANTMPQNDSTGLVVRSLKADFLSSARLGDLLEVKSKILKLGNSSVLMRQDIFKGEKLLFSCEIKLACIDMINQKIAKIPQYMLKILQRLI